MTSTLIDPRAFAIIDDELDGRPVLVVVGELDLFTGPELRRRAAKESGKTESGHQPTTRGNHHLNSAPAMPKLHPAMARGILPNHDLGIA